VERDTGKEISGISSCNSFIGTVEIAGGSLRFGQMAAKLSACIGSAAALESRLFAALENAASFKLWRHHVDIFDGQGKRLARFETRALE
jgi:heat shock protein HslJ